MASNFLQVNRNKRSLSLDLKTKGGAEAMHRLIASADVFVHNMRPEPLERLKFDYEHVRATKPDISQADRDACTDALLASGEAAPLDEHGKLPAGATHKAVRQRDGSVKVVRRRFSIA